MHRSSCCRLFLAVSGGTGALGRTYSRLGLSRQLGSSPRRPVREGEEDEGREVREQLERNILRAGLRALKGDGQALEKNIRDRAVAVDLQKLVWENACLNCVSLNPCSTSSRLSTVI